MIARAREVLASFASGRFVSFLAAGGFAALVNMSCRFILGQVLPYAPSIVVAYLVGMGVAYTLNRRFVFGASGRRVSQEVLRFAVVNLLAILQTLGVSLGLAWYALPALGIPVDTAETVAHVIGVMVPAVTSFIGHSYWTFARAPKPDASS